MKTRETGQPTLGIEIWSDVVCPWCYIGKRRLEHALTQFEHAGEVEISWRSFQLNPEAPRGEAIPTNEYMARRFGPQAAQMTARVTEIAKAEGLDFELGKALTTNTFDSHRLLHLAAGLGIAGPVKERLLRAYFVDGANGVPFFVIDRKYGISGAQPTETFLHALRTAWGGSGR